MKKEKNTKELNNMANELSDDMLDNVCGGTDDIVLNPPQSSSGNLVLNASQK